MIMEKNEKEEKVDVQKSTEKKMKFYMVLSLVLGVALGIVLAHLLVGCDNRDEVNDTVRYTNVGRAINDAMHEHLFSFYLLDGETQFVKSVPKKL